MQTADDSEDSSSEVVDYETSEEEELEPDAASLSSPRSSALEYGNRILTLILSNPTKIITPTKIKTISCTRLQAGLA